MESRTGNNNNGNSGDNGNRNNYRGNGVGSNFGGNGNGNNYGGIGNGNNYGGGGNGNNYGGVSNGNSFGGNGNNYSGIGNGNNYGGNGNAPYPQLNSVKKDITFARQVAPSMASELSGISEYSYQSIIFADVMPELSEFFDELAMTEMIHYKLLGELLEKLGVNPAIKTRVLNTPIDISDDTPGKAPVAAKRTLERNLKDEQNAAREYARLAQAATSHDVAMLLRRMSSDEEGHARRISQLLKG